MAKIKTKIKKRGNPDKKYEWEVYCDDHLRLWPDGSKIAYFSHKERSSFQVEDAWKRLGKSLVMPEPTSFDVWNKYAIPFIGSAKHPKGYYHSRVNNSYYDLLIVKDGVLGIKYNGKKINLVRGDVIVIPPGKLCDNFVNNVNTNLYWAHLKEIAYWSDIFGSDFIIKKLGAFEEICALFNAYQLEVYASNRTISVLELLAEAIVATLRREFKPQVPDKISVNIIEKLIKDINANPEKKWDTEVQASELGMSSKTLNKYFLAQCSRSFSKYLLDVRMKKALSYLKTGEHTNASISQKIGYSNAYSFSKAFYCYYGKYPRQMKKEFAVT